MVGVGVREGAGVGPVVVVVAGSLRVCLEREVGSTAYLRDATFTNSTSFGMD